MRWGHKNWSMVVLVSLVLSIVATPGLGQYLDCSTDATAPDSLVVMSMGSPYTGTPEFANVAVYVHVLRMSDGSGGLAQASIDSLFDQARQDFHAQNVYLGVAEQSDLADSTFYLNPIANSAQIFMADSHTNGIDLYFGPSSGLAVSKAEGIPSTALVLSGSLGSYRALSHVLGHCLGLYDTHETGVNGASSPGSSSGSDGDLISDTYADPGLGGNVNSDCSLDPSVTATYSPPPDASNIMSGGRMSCWSAFTMEQGFRMRRTLASIVEMQAVVEVNTGPYEDKSAETNIRDLVHFPAEPNNGVVFDFIGSSAKDMLIAGYYNPNSTYNLGIAAMQDGITNEGVPVFVDKTGDVFSSIQRPNNGSVGVIAADYDNDGYIDFYTPNPVYDSNWSHQLYRNTQGDSPPGNYTFEDVTVSAGLGNPPTGGHTANGSWFGFLPGRRYPTRVGDRRRSELESDST